MHWSTKALLAACCFAVLVWVAAPSGQSGVSSSTARGVTGQSQQRPEAPPIEIDAIALFRAYKANEVSADDSYKGKRLVVTGRVASIDKDMFDHIIVRLASGNMFQTVDATMLPSEKSQAAVLHKGTTVSFLCTGNGLIMDPQLDDCRFAQ